MGEAITQQVRGQHVYFIVEGADAGAAYQAAKAMGLRVIEFKRLDAGVPGVKEDKEIEVEETAEDGTKSKVKKTIQVLADVQPQVYRALGSGRDALERRAKSPHGMETVYVDKFHYAVKAMAKLAE